MTHISKPKNKQANAKWASFFHNLMICTTPDKIHLKDHYIIKNGIVITLGIWGQTDAISVFIVPLVLNTKIGQYLRS